MRFRSWRHGAQRRALNRVGFGAVICYNCSKTAAIKTFMGCNANQIVLESVRAVHAAVSSFCCGSLRTHNHFAGLRVSGDGDAKSIFIA